MPKFSSRSEERLSQCHPKLQKLFRAVVKHYDCTILVGHRDKETQQEKYENGQSKLQWPESKHNKMPSLAVDVSPYPIPDEWGEKSRDEYEKFRYFAFYVVGYATAMGIDIRWGGDWDMDKDVTDQSFNDLVHFELIL